jgi:hypothetical protein
MSSEQEWKRYRAMVSHRGVWYVIDNHTRSMMKCGTKQQANQQATALNEVMADSLYSAVKRRDSIGADAGV